MARVTETRTAVCRVSGTEYTRSNGVWNQTWEFNNRASRGNGSNFSITRDEVRKTPPGKIRRPLPYNAEGADFMQAHYSIFAYHQKGSLGFKQVRASGSWGAFAPTLEAVLPWDNAQIAERKVRMLKNIGDQKWSAGQALVEGREACAMIGKAARTLNKALQAAVRKDWRAVGKHLKVPTASGYQNFDTVASGWLAYNFGWQPLVSDIAGGLITLSELDDADTLTLSTSSHVKKSYTDGWSASGDPFVNGNTIIPVSINVSMRRTVELFWQGGVTYTVKCGSLRKLQQHGLTGLSTPWAVVPGSFLLDWLLPIGDYLAAYDATAGLSFDSGYETRFARASYRGLEVGYKTNGSSSTRVYEFSGNFSGNGNRFRMSRGPWTGLQPVAYLKDPLDIWKAATGLALFRADALGMRSSLGR